MSPCQRRQCQSHDRALTEPLEPVKPLEPVTEQLYSLPQNHSMHQAASRCIKMKKEEVSSFVHLIHQSNVLGIESISVNNPMSRPFLSSCRVCKSRLATRFRMCYTTHNGPATAQRPTALPSPIQFVCREGDLGLHRYAGYSYEILLSPKKMRMPS